VGTLHEDQYALLIIYRSVIPRMRMFQIKLVEKIKTHFVFSKFFFFENRAVYEIIWQNIVQPDRPQMTIQRMRIACWIPKATNPHSKYVIVVVFPLQKWLQERASMLLYKYIACLVTVCCVYKQGNLFSSKYE